MTTDRNRLRGVSADRSTRTPSTDPARRRAAARQGRGSRARFRLGAPAAAGLVVLVLALAAAGALAETKPARGKQPSATSDAPAAGSSAPAPATSTPWVSVDYSTLIDRRRLTHSGESVGELLDRLSGRPLPPPGERIPDRQAYMLLEPLLEPYAFVLPDALDSLQPAPDPPMVEIGSLWQPGEAQPAWAELLRSRHFVVESDGAGKLRLFLPLPAALAAQAASALAGSASPAPGSPAAPDAAAASEAAYREAWPVLRHVLAAEQRRLAHRAGATGTRAATSGAALPPLQVEARAYLHVPALSVFQLATRPFTTKVEGTGAAPGRGPADFAAWQAFLDRGQQIEGGRLTPDGRLKLIGSDTDVKPLLLGQPITLADLAVAHRAIFHGGLAEPYMSLDAWYAPQTAQVNYGGRLQDTTLGIVSLLSDVRFKTFSLGLDIVLSRDERERIRRAVPGFLTHMERFAADASSKDVLGQQTRFWFYPDTVDLSLSEQGDMLAIRRARLSAASERLSSERLAPGAAEDPQWTRRTIDAINGNYDALARLFPELSDLDQVARLLSLFTWLRQAASEGLAIPDLDTLLALELPARPTPRRFPMLLTHNTLRRGAGATTVDVLDRAPVGEGLDRLFPANGNPLPARERLTRALAALDPQNGDAAALLREADAFNVATAPDYRVDALTRRAERLRMHSLSVNGLPAEQLASLAGPPGSAEKPRVLSVSIGGVDLGMSAPLARASRPGRTLSPGGVVDAPGGTSGANSSAPQPAPGAGTASQPSAGTAATSGYGASFAGRSHHADPGSANAAPSAVQSGSSSTGAAGQTAGAPGASAPAPGSRNGAGAAGAQPSGSAGSSGGAAGRAGEAGAAPAAEPGSSAATQQKPALPAPADPPGLPALEVPDHGFVGAAPGPKQPGGAEFSVREFGDSWIARAEQPGGGGTTVTAVLGAGSPEVRSRRETLDGSRRAQSFERLEGLQFLSYKLQADGARLRAVAVDKPRPQTRTPDGKVLLDQPPVPPQGLITFQVAGQDESKVFLRMRRAVPGGTDVRDLAAAVPRPLLWRLVLGHGADMQPGQALRGLDPPSLGVGSHLMVFTNEPQRTAPWSLPPDPIAGEEDPVRVASALKIWWDGNGDPIGIVVGTDPQTSAAHWAAAPGAVHGATLLLPADAFPGPAASLRDAMAATWKKSAGSDAVASLPSGGSAPPLVLLASAESPGKLAARLRALSRQPSLKGRLLAVWSLSGPLREDLPALLLSDGNLAGLGLADSGPVGLPAVPDQLGKLGAALPGTGDRRVEDLPGPILWFF